MKRRTFLKTAGEAALLLSAGVLTGCGGNNETPGSSVPKQDPENPDKEPNQGEDGKDDTEDGGQDDEKGIRWTYEVTGADTATLTGYDPSKKVPAGVVVLPDTVGERYTVTKIGEKAFSYFGNSNGQQITAVEIPDTVTEIEQFAFYRCEHLSRVKLPGRLKILGEFAFSLCALTSMTLPGSLETTGDYSFQNCKQLAQVELGYGIKMINPDTFGGCDALKKIDIPGSVEIISNHAFYKCAGLETFEYPEGTYVVDGYALAKCTALRSVTLSSTIAQIFTSAFSEDPLLTDIYYKGTEEQWNMIRLEDDRADGKKGLEGITVHIS